MATVPTVAAVATLEPEVAENSVDAPMLARSSTSPSMMNNGIATSRNSLFELHDSSPMARDSGSMENNGSSVRPSTPRAAPTGMDRPISTSRRIRAVAIMRLLP